MKSLLFCILFLFFNTINPLAQDRRIIFPEDKTISHEDSMGIILIDHIYNGRREKAVEMLKSGKVGGHTKDINRYYAIQYAMEDFDTTLISLLIEKGALLENENGGDFLWADYNNHFKLSNFRELIEGGRCGWMPNEDEKHSLYDTIIADYLTRKHIKIVNATKSRSDMTKFYIKNGYLSMTRKFIDRGVLFSDSFKTLDSPIIEACLSGNFEIFKLFVDRGYKINEETIIEQNALHFACLGGEGKIINYLIAKGVGLNKRNKCENWSQYETPQEMFQCLLKGSLKTPELIQYFFDQKINLKYSDYWYWLFSNHWNIKKSSWRNVFKAADILLKNGVSPNYQGYDLTESYKNSLYFMASSCMLNDSTAIEFSKLFVENGIKLSVLDVRKHLYPFDLLRGSYDYGCPKSYFRTVSYLLSICPYFDPWHFDYKIRRDPGEIPYRIGYFKDFYFLD